MAQHDAGGERLQTVEALLGSLTCDKPVRSVQAGVYWTAVVLEGTPPRCGLASTLRSENHDATPPVLEAGALLERSGRELATLLRSPRIVEASIGMAAVNAMLDIDEASCQELNAAELLTKRAEGRRVAVVGHFPFVKRLRQVAASCAVLEQRPRPGDLMQDHAAEVLPEADVVAITGTSIINHTFDDLVDLCQPSAFVVVLGGSAPLSSVLLERGVSAISGTTIVDVDAAVRAVAQGATFRQIPGRRLLSLLRTDEGGAP